MSIESASRFLRAAAQDQTIREKFAAASSPAEFLQVSDQMGYCFTTTELEALIQELSQGAMVRRSTGVWKWLRNVNWVEKSRNSRYEGQVQDFAGV